jgi:tetratricopeptide (TPR) repeat protein
MPSTTWAGRNPATGQPRQALANYERALNLYRQTNHRGGEAATLHNLGAVYNGLGDRQQAFTHYQRTSGTGQSMKASISSAAWLRAVARSPMA